MVLWINKMNRKILLLIMAVIITWNLLSEPMFISMFIKSEEIVVEIADTNQKKALGLMFRKSIPDNYGMLFIYSEEDQRAMWMKNALVSLDLIFLNAQKEVVEIIRNVPPCKKDPCKTYISKIKAQYVLEVRGNRSKEIELQAGDRLFFIL